LAGTALTGLLALVLAAPAMAMQFETLARDDGSYAILATGPVVSGDMGRLLAAAKSIPGGATISLITLDSPGGDVGEGLRMAQVIHQARLTSFVLPGSKCASICFFMFVAAPVRLAAPDALIGVHSATQKQGETMEAKATTTELARIAADYGVPPEILGLMIQARPRQMEWLTPELLASLDVRIVSPSGEAQKPRKTPAPEREASASPPQPQPQPQLQPRDAPQPVVARPAQADAMGGPAFRGALFCRQGIRQIVLEFGPPQGEAASQATLSYTPGPASRDLATGSLLMEGKLDLAAGAISIRPTAWVSRSGEASMIGLSGRSNDGGQTFQGQATAGMECTSFTMRRTR
jgi:hypothetical protein